MTDVSDVIAALRSTRLDLRLPAQAVADRSAHLTRGKIAKYESGVITALTVADLLDWCAALEVSPAVILGAQPPADTMSLILDELREQTALLRELSQEPRSSVPAEAPVDR